jgi:hypothetical protein
VARWCTRAVMQNARIWHALNFARLWLTQHFPLCPL